MLRRPPEAAGEAARPPASWQQIKRVLKGTASSRVLGLRWFDMWGGRGPGCHDGLQDVRSRTQMSLWAPRDPLDLLLS